MFGFIKRMKRAMSSDFSKVFDSAEEPEEMLQSYVNHLSQEVKAMEVEVSKMIAEEKRVAKRLQEAKEKVQQRERQALQAVEAGKDELALRYIEDKAKVTKEVEYLEIFNEKTKTNLHELKHKLKQAQSEYQQMQIKYEAMNNKTGTIMFEKKEDSNTTVNEDEQELQRMKEIIKNKHGWDK
ncbi:PspA/IM30 family protein [Evansella sp. AB-rgal1]|uniref:PspA/IM30 family protein n=1 Tax=Evansella sp. AB-rgal1 TaxID=3242696 RepID=UPI00359DF509